MPSREVRRIYGVDFSGAVDAGRKIWITSGIVRASRLIVEDCFQGAALPGATKDRTRCLAALRAFIGDAGPSIFGLDFPLGLPRELLGRDSWAAFIREFPHRFEAPQFFRQWCLAAAGGRELKRRTDREARTPFSPYNLRLYRQTYFGLRELISPLVRRRKVCVRPMQTARLGLPWLIEICPASTLKQRQLYVPYKGKSIGHRAARSSILRSISRAESIELAAPIRSRLLDDPEGDALDSFIAAAAVFGALESPQRLNGLFDQIDALEGRVFV
jgi:hypothetical protein